MFKFKKQERLCSKKLIEKLFKEGKVILLYPLKITYLIVDEGDSIYPAKVVFVVSKKKFKKAFKRNRIKRLLRETYRLNKNVLYEILNNKKKHLLIGISYIANDEKKFNDLNSTIKKSIFKISESIN